jgi:hypothetical protein
MIVHYTDRTIRIFNWSNNMNTTLTNSGQANHYSNIVQENGKFLLEQTWELPEQVKLFYMKNLYYMKKSNYFFL